jgi:hypothetical protein
MEIVGAAWLAVFILFSLALIFAWSKIFIIAGKVRRMETMFDSMESMEAKSTADSPK